MHQFGSYYAVHVVREARLYGARPYALHATHVKVRARVRARVRIRVSVRVRVTV